MILDMIPQILYSKPLIMFLTSCEVSISCEVSLSLYHPLQSEKRAALNHVCGSELDLFAPFWKLDRDAYSFSFLLTEGIQYPQFAQKHGTDLYSMPLLNC